MNSMRRPLVIVLVSMVLFWANAWVQKGGCEATLMTAGINHAFASGKEVTELAMAGAINKELGIHMRVRIEDNKITGYYYYDAIKTNIVVKGMKVGSSVVINEYDATGERIAEFHGAFVDDSRIEGI